MFVNPPYGLSASPFIQKLAEHGDGILLVTMRAETNYFHDWVWGKACGMLVIRRRVSFCTSDGVESTGNTGGATVLFAYGYSNWNTLNHASDLGYATKLRRDDE